MFKKYISFALIACTALFYACSTTNPLLDKAESNIVDENFDAAIDAAKQFIEEEPNNSLGYYYLGTALGQKGQDQEPPSEGTTFFKQMDEAYKKAESLADTAGSVPDEVKRIPEVKKSFWRIAHNSAIKLINDDSVRTSYENPDERAYSYITNALVIQQNHPITYQVKAILSGRLQKYDEAADAQEKFINMADSVTARNYLVLVQYYRQADELDQAEDALMQAQKEFPENEQINAFLADVYTQQGKTEEAIDLVKDLVERDPENPQYRLSYGSRLLIASSKIQDKYKDNVNEIFDLQRSQSEDNEQKIQSLYEKNDQLREQITEMQDKAAEQFKKVLELRPEDAKASHNLGVVYQNRAALYYALRNLSQSQNEAEKYDEQADDLLREAQKYYEKAVEIEPDNKDYWKSLYVVYTNLGL
ncbi:MAG TPA: tetratricopeptide repeat protein, partial [Balneolaceae bacterium]|nr:tetratricopeptide repeat protein [Balneolaceae bacterium]